MLCSGQNGGESAGFSVFGNCSVDLQREGFVFLSDTAFVQTRECLHAEIQDHSTSEIVCFLHEINQMCISKCLGYSCTLWVSVIRCLDEAFIINGIYFCRSVEAHWLRRGAQ